MMREPYENGLTYKASITDLESGLERKTGFVSCNEDSLVFPLNQQIEIKGKFLNVLAAAVNHKEIIEYHNGYPTVVGYQDIPRFAINVASYGTYPTAPATIITPGVSKGVVAVETETEEPMPEMEADPAVTEIANEKDKLMGLTKDTLISMAKKKGIDVKAQSTKAEIADAILAAEL